MTRNVSQQLKALYDLGYKKPILLTGMRGVGKTTIACDFAKDFFESHLYFNFENDNRLKSAFEASEEDVDFWKIIDSYLNASGRLPYDALYIFDEIDACPQAHEKLMTFINTVENSIKLLIVSSRSFDNNSHPHAKQLDIIPVYPLSFDEFLMALGHEWYKDIIIAHFETMRKIPEIVHYELLDLFNDYLRIGGMPDVVNQFISRKSFENIEERQKLQYGAIISDIMLEEEGLRTRLLQIMEAISDQFEAGNAKFRFNRIRKGVTYNFYKDAIDRLIELGVVIKVNKSTKTALNTEDYDESSFRLFYGDTGLLNYRMRSRNYYEEEEQERAVLLSYMYETINSFESTVSYWESDSRTIIDGLIKNNNNILLPIELKTSGTRKGKIVELFLNNNKNASEAYVLTEGNFKLDGQVHYIPLYALFCLKYRFY